jgi:hypothetical protein
LHDYHELADARFERLANISSAHTYNPRKLRSHRDHVMVFTKSRPPPVSIGERRKPLPQENPGYLRVDTVHQGDLDGVKGVYHINLVDEVMQWEIVGAVERISESYLNAVTAASEAVSIPHSRLSFGQWQ